MNQLLRDALDAATADLARAQEPPPEPWGYGRDLSCDVDLRADMGVVEGVTLLGQAVIRRWTTPRGTLPDDADYGEDVRSYLHRGLTPGAPRELEGLLANEARKDDRIDSITVAVTAGAGLRSLSVEAVVVPVDQALGPFTLVLALSDAGVLTAAIRAGGST